MGNLGKYTEMIVKGGVVCGSNKLFHLRVHL